MKKGFLIKNGFLLVAGISGGLLAKSLGSSFDTALLFGALSVVVALLGLQSPKLETR